MLFYKVLTRFFAHVEYVQQRFQVFCSNIIMMNPIFLPQGSRMDGQRCSAPFLNIGTPSTQKINNPSSSTSDLTLKRSLSFSRFEHQKEASPSEQKQFLKMMSHAQGGRMEEQRCSLQPSRSTHATPTHNGRALHRLPS
ncbi:hypothetical protein F7725_003292, partial [Dissostichus mawsoni]